MVQDTCEETKEKNPIKIKAFQKHRPQAQQGDHASDFQNARATNFCFCLVKPCAGPFIALWIDFPTYQMRELDSIIF